MKVQDEKEVIVTIKKEEQATLSKESEDNGVTKVESQEKKQTDYFKLAELAVEATKNANPSILDSLGIYRGPIFTALVSYFVLHLVGFDFIAELVGVGLVSVCIVHKIIHMGEIKEDLNVGISKAIISVKDTFKKTDKKPKSDKEE
jgi:hypothetical protein